jgi:hypothetical protein
VNLKTSDGSVVAGRATHSGEVLNEVQDKERDHGRTGWGLGLGLTFAPDRNSFVLKHRQQGGQGPKMSSSVIEEKEEGCVCLADSQRILHCIK